MLQSLAHTRKHTETERVYFAHANEGDIICIKRCHVVTVTNIMYESFVLSLNGSNGNRYIVIVK